jgi:hypothetical protein
MAGASREQVINPLPDRFRHYDEGAGLFTQRAVSTSSALETRSSKRRSLRAAVACLACLISPARRCFPAGRSQILQLITLAHHPCPVLMPSCNLSQQDSIVHGRALGDSPRWKKPIPCFGTAWLALGVRSLRDCLARKSPRAGDGSTDPVAHN